MEMGTVLKYAAIGVAGYFAAAKLGVFGPNCKEEPLIPLWKLLYGYNRKSETTGDWEYKPGLISGL